MNPINKVRTYSDDLVFKRPGGAIGIGMSEDYMLATPYAESCDTCWYQGVTSTKTNDKFGTLVLYTDKPPGGSLFFEATNGFYVDNTNGYLDLTGKTVYIIEFWIKEATGGGTIYVILTTDFDDVGKGIKIITTTDTPSKYKLYLGSSAGGWDIANPFIIGDSTGGWDHISVFKYGNDYYCSLNGSVQYITQTNNEVYLVDSRLYFGSYSDASLPGTFYITNIRFMFGYDKYSINGFTPPICPLSAVGYSGQSIESPLLLNVFQDSKRLNNSGDRYFNITTTPSLNSPLFDGQSPFSNNIPRIYTKTYNSSANDYINLINTYITQGGSPPVTTFTDAVNEVISSTRVWVQNCNYEDIPTSGLTLCLDSGYFFSYPKTGSTWYDLVGDGSVNDGFSFSGTPTNSGFSGNTTLGFSGSNFAYYNQGFTLNNTFTCVCVFSSSSGVNWDGSSYLPIFSGNNGFNLQVTNGGNSVKFNLITSGGVTNSITTITPGDIRSNNMFAISSNGSNLHKIYLNGGLSNTDTSTINRISQSISYIEVSNGVSTNYLSLLIYDRQLSDSEITRIYSAYKSRMNIP